MGFCFLEEDDEKLARGWPNLIVPVDGLTQDKRPAIAAQKAWRVGDPIYFTEWPRETLYRFMHAAIATVFVQHKPEHWQAILKAFDVPGPPDAKESLAALRRLFREGYDTYNFKERDFVFAVETIAGADATLATLIDEIAHFEAPKKNPGLNHYCRAALVEACAFLMLRASPSAVKDARKKLEVAYAAPRDPKVEKEYEQYYGALDYVGHGAAGVKRQPPNWITLEVPANMGPSLDYASDDLDYVRDAFARHDKKAPMSVRVASLVGPASLEGLAARKWRAAQMPSVVRDFGMVRDPQIVSFMLSLVGKSSSKDAPLAWFRAHADYAMAILAKTPSATAKAVMKQIA